MKSLTLVAKKEVKFNDGGEKIKHIFVDSEKNSFIGWSDKDSSLSDELIETSAEYNSARAREYEIDVNEYDGKMRSKVIIN